MDFSWLVWAIFTCICDCHAPRVDWFWLLSLVCRWTMGVWCGVHFGIMSCIARLKGVCMAVRLSDSCIISIVRDVDSETRRFLVDIASRLLPCWSYILLMVLFDWRVDGLAFDVDVDEDRTGADAIDDAFELNAFELLLSWSLGVTVVGTLLWLGFWNDGACEPIAASACDGPRLEVALD